MVGVVRMTLMNTVYSNVPAVSKKNLAKVPTSSSSPPVHMAVGLRTAMISRVHNQKSGCGSCGR